MARGRGTARPGLAGALERHPAVGVTGAVVGLAAATTAVGVAVAAFAEDAHVVEPCVLVCASAD